MQTAEHEIISAPHVLEPLSAREIETAAVIVMSDRQLGENAQFVYITLMEPDKRSAAVGREALVVLRDRAMRAVYEAVVSLSEREVRSWREIPGVQAPLMRDEIAAFKEVVRQDPRWQEAMRRQPEPRPTRTRQPRMPRSRGDRP